MTIVPEVIVLGAGFAGLACATELAEAGARVLVLESSGAPGGRAGSFREPVTGDLIDVGQHVLVGANRAALRLIERLGTRGQIAFQRALSIDYVWPGGRRERLACPPLPSPLHLALGLLRFGGLPLRERLRALAVGRAARRLARDGTSSGGVATDGPLPRPDETVDAWLERLGQGPAARRILWEPLAIAALNDVPSRSSALLLARVLAETFSGGPAASGLGWPRGPLRDLLEPAGAWLAARRGGLRCSSPATRLEFEGGRVAAVRLRGGSTVLAPQFVSALPAAALAALLDGAPAGARPVLDAARRFAGRASPILSVYLWSEAPLLEGPFCTFPEGPFPWLFEKRRMAEPGRPGKAAVRGAPRAAACTAEGAAGHARELWLQTLVLSGARGWMERHDDSILDSARNQIERSFPGSAARLRHARVVRQPAATFEPAPDLCAARPGPRTTVPNLWLAGDWTDTGLPSTLEGAARSGVAAARALMRVGDFRRG